MELKPLSDWYEDKEGVSPVIAVILMVAITVVLAAVVYTWASGLAETGGGGGTPASCSQGSGNWVEIQSDPPRVQDRNTADYQALSKANGTVYEGGSTADNTTFTYTWSGTSGDNIQSGDVWQLDTKANEWRDGDRFDFSIRDNQGALVTCPFQYST